MIGYAFTGSFCTHKASLEALEHLVKCGEEVLPIMSENTFSTDTRFGRAEDLVERVESLTGHKVIHTIKDAEPIGPSLILDLLVLSPCTGNTLSKLASGITDTAVTMAGKAQLRSDRPLLIALASNDALSGNLKNIGTLFTRKNIFFVPLYADSPSKKPYSMIADFQKLPEAIRLARLGKQMHPLFLGSENASRG